MSDKSKICLIGLGGAGCGIITRLNINSKHISTVAIDTDKQVLLLCKADEKIIIGESITKGLSSGGKPEIGEKAALNDENSIKEIIENSDIVIIAVGLGGGTGSGACSVILRLARELKILTIVIYTTPFGFEGGHQMQITQNAINNIIKYADAYLPVDNNKLLKTINNKTFALTAYSRIDEIFGNFITCVSRMIYDKNGINNEYFNLMLTLKNTGGLCFTFGKCSNYENIALALNRALAYKLLDVSFEKAVKIFISVRGDDKLSPNEKSEIIKSVESILPNKDTKIFLNHCIENESDYFLFLITVNIRESNQDINTDSETEINQNENINYRETFNKYKENIMNKMIFMSYNHADKSIADKIDEIIVEILKDEYIINRDIRKLEYKDSIKKFMESIKVHNYVLMLVSKSYLESVNCMFEVLETMKNDDFKERMLFIILDDANIYNEGSVLVYQNYWASKINIIEKEIEKEKKNKNIPSVKNLSEDWGKYMKIHLEIGEFINTLRDEIGYNIEELFELEFEPIINYIRRRDEEIYK